MKRLVLLSAVILPIFVAGCETAQDYARQKSNAELCYDSRYGRFTQADYNEFYRRRLQCTPDMYQIGAQIAARKAAEYQQAINSIGDTIQKAGESRNPKQNNTTCTSQVVGNSVITRCN